MEVQNNILSGKGKLKLSLVFAVTINFYCSFLKNSIHFMYVNVQMCCIYDTKNITAERYINHYCIFLHEI